jgi:hypothetical protein
VDGGQVDHLFFAVVGDTRPPFPDETQAYPTAIIEKIYEDLDTLGPRPQFAVGVGDYMFASLDGGQAATQMKLYSGAVSRYHGPVFAALGNHDCAGAVSINCANQMTGNFQAYLDYLVFPLGKTLPYYSIPIEATDHSWTAKVLILACNAWDNPQITWMNTELARPTTFTFVVRHEPAGTTAAPCEADVARALAAYPYNLSIVGHIHTFQLSGNQLMVGNGGAPLMGYPQSGYTTVEQVDAGFRVTSYDYGTRMPLSSQIVPF